MITRAWVAIPKSLTVFENPDDIRGAESRGSSPVMWGTMESLAVTSTENGEGVGSCLTGQARASGIGGYPLVVMVAVDGVSKESAQRLLGQTDVTPRGSTPLTSDRIVTSHTLSLFFSHQRAIAQSPETVRAHTPSNSATSSSVRPP